MTMTMISFDWKEFSRAAFDSWLKTLQTFKLHLYDLDESVHKQPIYSSDWILVVSDKEMTVEELKNVWRENFGEDTL